MGADAADDEDAIGGVVADGDGGDVAFEGVGNKDD